MEIQEIQENQEKSKSNNNRLILHEYEVILQDVHYSWIDTDEETGMVNLCKYLQETTNGFRIGGPLRYKGPWPG